LEVVDCGRREVLVGHVAGLDDSGVVYCDFLEELDDGVVYCIGFEIGAANDADADFGDELGLELEPLHVQTDEYGFIEKRRGVKERLGEEMSEGRPRGVAC
jgi:hypothetical protein